MEGTEDCDYERLQGHGGLEMEGTEECRTQGTADGCARYGGLSDARDSGGRHRFPLYGTAAGSRCKEQTPTWCSPALSLQGWPGPPSPYMDGRAQALPLMLGLALSYALPSHPSFPLVLISHRAPCPLKSPSLPCLFHSFASNYLVNGPCPLTPRPLLPLSFSCFYPPVLYRSHASIS